ncbi:unnamed protein product [Amoebophrya sp. A25]|nr:unnamed protein product [Amoebophrya sp. A25]|eukprot:GSA25T00003398001.1
MDELQEEEKDQVVKMKDIKAPTTLPASPDSLASWTAVAEDVMEDMEQEGDNHEDVLDGENNLDMEQEGEDNHEDVLDAQNILDMEQEGEDNHEDVLDAKNNLDMEQEGENHEDVLDGPQNNLDAEVDIKVDTQKHVHEETSTSCRVGRDLDNDAELEMNNGDDNITDPHPPEAVGEEEENTRNGHQVADVETEDKPLLFLDPTSSKLGDNMPPDAGSIPAASSSSTPPAKPEAAEGATAEADAEQDSKHDSEATTSPEAGTVVATSPPVVDDNVAATPPGVVDDHVVKGQGIHLHSTRPEGDHVVVKGQGIHLHSTRPEGDKASCARTREKLVRFALDKEEEIRSQLAAAYHGSSGGCIARCIAPLVGPALGSQQAVISTSSASSKNGSEVDLLHAIEAEWLEVLSIWVTTAAQRVAAEYRSCSSEREELEKEHLRSPHEALRDALSELVSRFPKNTDHVGVADEQPDVSSCHIEDYHHATSLQDDCEVVEAGKKDQRGGPPSAPSAPAAASSSSRSNDNVESYTYNTTTTTTSRTFRPPQHEEMPDARTPRLRIANEEDKRNDQVVTKWIEITPENKRIDCEDKGSSTMEDFVFDEYAELPLDGKMVVDASNTGPHDSAYNGPNDSAYKTSAQTLLPSWLRRNLKKHGLATPMLVQRYAIPPALASHDVTGVAKTGSGKTFAFLIPALCYLYKNWGHMALICAPTRELAQQINTEFEKIAKGSQIYSVCLVGGERTRRDQEYALPWAKVVVGTCGRLRDFLFTTNGTKLDVTKCGFLAIDEADKMLEEGFQETLFEIVSRIRIPYQTMFFSATWPKHVEGLASALLCDHVAGRREGQKQLLLKVEQDEGVDLTVDERIQQQVVVWEDDYGSRDLQKRRHMCSYVSSEFEKNPESKMVLFMNAKRDVQSVVEMLAEYGPDVKVVNISGDLNQWQRSQALWEFSNGEARIMVATDVLARGVDVSGITHVIIYEFQTLENYVHRIGRTARGRDAKGKALIYFSYYAKMPENAKGLIGMLRSANQVVPSALQQIADDVESGAKKTEIWHNRPKSWWMQQWDLLAKNAEAGCSWRDLVPELNEDGSFTNDSKGLKNPMPRPGGDPQQNSKQHDSSRRDGGKWDDNYNKGSREERGRNDDWSSWNRGNWWSTNDGTIGRITQRMILPEVVDGRTETRHHGGKTMTTRTMRGITGIRKSRGTSSVIKMQRRAILPPTRRPRLAV